MTKFNEQMAFEQKVDEFMNLFNSEQYASVGYWLEDNEQIKLHENIGLNDVTLTFQADNSNLTPITKIVSYEDYLTCMIYIDRYSITDFCYEYMDMKRGVVFLTHDLDEITKLFDNDVKGTLKDEYMERIKSDFSYLLGNPRKEVVELALEHKDDFRFDSSDFNKGLEYQVVPELKELIKKELQ